MMRVQPSARDWENGHAHEPSGIPDSLGRSNRAKSSVLNDLNFGMEIAKCQVGNAVFEFGKSTGVISNMSLFSSRISVERLAGNRSFHFHKDDSCGGNSHLYM